MSAPAKDYLIACARGRRLKPLGRACKARRRRLDAMWNALTPAEKVAVVFTYMRHHPALPGAAPEQP